MNRLLAPRSIAIVGLSSDPAKHGGRVLANLRKLGFSGPVWGVNPKLPDVEGIPVVGTLADLPETPDVVVCAVPAPIVPGVVRDAGDRGAGVAVVFAGGFAEAGDEGRSLQEELLVAARDTGVRVLGPNSGGVIAPSSRLAMSFLTCLDRPAAEIRTGPVGLVTQSGGTGSYVHNLAAARGSGLAASISTGNEADVDIADGIEALTGFDEVRAIGVILETVRDGPAFMDAVRRAVHAGKPVVVTRVGTSSRGRRLMQSHTGALAGPARVLEGVLDSLGVSVAETPAEMLDIAEVMAAASVPAGDRVAIVTHSGGIAILLSDLAERSLLPLPAPSPELQAELAPLLQQGSAGNPLDMGGIIGGPHRFGEVVSRFAGSSEFDTVLAVSTAHPPAHTDARVDGLLELKHPDVPITHLWMAGDVGAHGLARLRAAGLPVTEEPRAAIRALAGLTRLGTMAATPPLRIEPPVAPADAAGEHRAKQRLSSWGIPVVAGALATSVEQAIEIAQGLGFPVVAKVSSADITHKTEIGGVRPGLDDPAAVAAAYEAILAGAPDVPIDGVRIERQMSGPEVIAGAIRDDTFGPMVLVGLGGTLAEALNDARMAPAPIPPDEVRRLIDRLLGLTVLTEPRSGPPADLDALAGIVATLGAHLAADPGISELEINPLAWTPDGWLALDAVIRTTI